MRLSTKYDALFNKYRKKIPLAYMRALAWGESRFNTDSVHSQSNATGLLQVTRTVIESYNERHGTTFALSDMLDPELNVMVASDTLNRIYWSYAKNHPNSLAPNWDNENWVQLFTIGWNAGYSEKAGVGRVVTELEKRGGALISAKNVAITSKKIEGVSKHLSNPARLKWSLEVTNKYFREPESKYETEKDISLREKLVNKNSMLDIAQANSQPFPWGKVFAAILFSSYFWSKIK